MSKLGAFAQDLVIRAVKTFAQTLLALIVADGATNLLAVDWTAKFSVAGMAAVVSALTTIASYTFTQSPAVGEAVTPNPQVVAKVDTSTKVPEEAQVRDDSGKVLGTIVAADASPVANGTPVEVVPVSPAPPPPVVE